MVNPKFDFTINDENTNEQNDLFQQEITRGYNISPLPATKKEINTINNLLQNNKWDVKLLSDTNATETNVKAIKSPKILHFATHGFFKEYITTFDTISGIGIGYKFMSDTLFVDNVTPKSPADKSGLIEGDKIIFIDSLDVSKTTSATKIDGYSSIVSDNKFSYVTKLLKGRCRFKSVFKNTKRFKRFIN